jgi:hypothetical protein
MYRQDVHGILSLYSLPVMTGMLIADAGRRKSRPYIPDFLEMTSCIITITGFKTVRCLSMSNAFSIGSKGIAEKTG